MNRQPDFRFRQYRTLALLFLIGSSVGVIGAEDLVTPESRGMRSADLIRMSEWVRSEELDVRAMIVMRRGAMVMEWYASGVTRDHHHNVFSITKSVVSTLAGIAVREGKLPGVEVTLKDVFPDSPGLTGDSQKAEVTLEDLLTMRSGLPCSRGNKPDGPEKRLFNRIHAAKNRTALCLGLEMAGKPGEKFIYGNVEPQLVLAMVEKAGRTPALPLAEKVLFQPLGFENAKWVFTDQTRAVPGGYGLRLRGVDLAKLGQLYLEKGQWKGKTILSADWVEAATKDQTGTGYGYFWWTGLKDGAFAAKGVRGQQIYVDPSRDLVFVVTADLPPEQVGAILKKLTQEYVLKSVVSGQSLPSDAEQESAMIRELENASRYVPAHRKNLPKSRLPGQ